MSLFAVRTNRHTTFQIYSGAKIYINVSQTVVRGPQVVLGFCLCGPFRLNISPKGQKK